MRINNWLRLIILTLIIYSSSIIILGATQFQRTLILIPQSFWIISSLFIISSHFISSIRWFYFVNYLKKKISYIDSLKIYIAGLSLMAAPARSGESIRSIWLLNRHSLPINIGISITITERIGELISAILLISLCLNTQNIVYIIIIVLSIVLCLQLIKDINLIAYLKKIAFFIPFLKNLLSHPNFKQEASIIIKQIKQLSRLKPLLISITLSSLTWIIESILLFKTFSSLSVALSLEQSILIRTLMGIGGVISLFPGGLLTSESTSIALSIAYGSGKAEAFAATLFIRIYTLFLPSLVGLIAVILQKDLNSPSSKINASQ